MLSSQALCLAQLGRLDEAERGYLKALAFFIPADARSDNVAAHTSASLNVLNNLGLLYTQQKRLDKAHETLDELVRGRAAVSGPNHPHTLSAMQNMGTLLIEEREYEQAIELLSDISRRRAELQGDVHSDTIVARCALADALREGDRAAEAADVARRALDAVRSSPEQRPEHAAAARLAMRALARALRVVGTPEEAEPLHQEVLRQRVELFGAAFPSAVEARADLAACLREMGREEDAAKLEAA